MHVLVCSSNPVVVNAVAQAFEGGGHRLTVCESGLETVGTVGVLEADLLIVDREAPGLNGLLLVSAVREIAPALPIVAVSTRSEVADARALAQKGVTCWRLPAGPNGAGPAWAMELAQSAGARAAVPAAASLASPAKID
jgi:CheY-like chemotaxis protein